MRVRGLSLFNGGVLLMSSYILKNLYITTKGSIVISFLLSYLVVLKRTVK